MYDGAVPHTTKFSLWRNGATTQFPYKMVLVQQEIERRLCHTMQLSAVFCLFGTVVDVSTPPSHYVHNPVKPWYNDFVANRFLMKLFKTNNMEIINTCREEFKFSLPSQQISVRNAKFMESDGAKIDIMRWCCVQL